MSTARPDWCQVIAGSSNALLIAPHGGRRPLGNLTAPRERKVNDLHTADVTTHLATLLDATAIINAGCDRNELDLNRIGQISRQAPWFFDLLLDQLQAIITRHGTAHVLLIHGWNVVQPKCDLGIGGRESPDGLAPIGEAALSVDPRYWQSRVATFRAVCAAAGILTPVGERYPAANKSNLLQAFTPRFAEAPDGRLRQLAAWARAAQLNAVQLELGIPLRWPGPLRDQLYRAAVAGFGATQPQSPAPPSVTPSPALESLDPLGFHFHDPRHNLTIFTSITPAGPITWGRLLLFLGGQEIALFTGEEPGMRAAVSSLRYAGTPAAVDLHFHGHATRLGDARLYLELEAALAASTLADVRLALRFERSHHTLDHDASPGRFVGSLEIDGQRLDIAASGFCDPGVGLRGPGRHASRTHLAAVFDDGSAFNLRAVPGEPHLAGLLLGDSRIERAPRGHIDVAVDRDPDTPDRFTLHLSNREAPVLVTPLARMPIMRPMGDRHYARITFGPARYEWGDRSGWGVFEHARRLPRPEP